MNGLEIRGLNVEIGTFALKNVDLVLPQGTVTGLIGRNGAGKSTLIKTIMRQLDAKSGKILYNGKTYAEHEEEILLKTAVVFDRAFFNPQAKPKRIEKYYMAAYPDFDDVKYKSLMKKFNLPDNKKYATFSFGMQRKYCLILALCQGADLLILDEPSSGIDPFDRNEIVSLVQEFMLDEKHTVLFSTHITEDLDKIADYIVMMEDGRVVLSEEKDALTERYRLVQTDVMTAETERIALGQKKSAFGYSFVVKKEDLTATENMKVKIPTVEELFVHLTGNFGSGEGIDNARSSKEIFGL